MFQFCVITLALVVGISANPVKRTCDNFPSSMEVLGCCDAPQLIDETAWVRCARTPDSIKVDKPTVFPKCAADCLFRELGFVQHDRLDYEAIKNWLLAAVGEQEDWKSKIDLVSTQCAELMENTNTTNLESYPCNSKADFYILCLHETTLLNCPVESWANNRYTAQSCREIKETIDSCPHPIIDPAPFRP